MLIVLDNSQFYRDKRGLPPPGTTESPAWQTPLDHAGEPNTTTTAGKVLFGLP
jgi:hypothetical protein